MNIKKIVYFRNLGAPETQVGIKRIRFGLVNLMNVLLFPVKYLRTHQELSRRIYLLLVSMCLDCTI